MSREAMKQALEALEAGDWHIGELEEIVYSPERAKIQSAITALRAALDAPEPEPVAWMHNMLDGVVVAHRPADLKRHPERWTALYKERK